MKPTPAPAASSAALDFKKSLLETFAINERANSSCSSTLPKPPGTPRLSLSIT